MDRFAGTVEQFATVDVSGLAAWIAPIYFEDWPQQHRLADGKIRPAMVNDPGWYGFKVMTDPIVTQLMAYFPGCVDDNRMLSVIMPGHSIEPHKDWQSPQWRCRVHVPLTSNRNAKFISDVTAYRMKPGRAYMVNTEATHAIENFGSSPRIHLMFDVRTP